MRDGLGGRGACLGLERGNDLAPTRCAPRCHPLEDPVTAADPNGHGTFTQRVDANIGIS
jgi:hypothetical protein